MLDSELDDHEIALRDKIRKFGIDHVRPIINDAWEHAEFPYEILPELKKIGIVGNILQSYGAPGFSRRKRDLLSSELGRIDETIFTFIGVCATLPMDSTT